MFILENANKYIVSNKYFFKFFVLYWKTNNFSVFYDPRLFTHDPRLFTHDPRLFTHDPRQLVKLVKATPTVFKSLRFCPSTRQRMQRFQKYPFSKVFTFKTVFESLIIYN